MAYWGRDKQPAKTAWHSLMFVLVIVFHIFVTYFIFSRQPSLPLLPQEASLTYIIIPVATTPALEVTLPQMSAAQFTLYIPTPDPPAVLSIESDEGAIAIPSGQDHMQTTIFDPRLRQKLEEARALNHARVSGADEVFKRADGRTYRELGNGNCQVTMEKMDSRDRATNWGVTNCGKTDSESMMDRVMADFESSRGRP
jgi:hypothetical protein